MDPRYRLRTGLLADPMLSRDVTQAQEGAKFIGVSPQEYTGIQARLQLGEALRTRVPQMSVGPSPHNDEAGDLPARPGVDNIGVPLPPPRPPGVGLPRGYIGPTFDELLRRDGPGGDGADLPTRPEAPWPPMDPTEERFRRFVEEERRQMAQDAQRDAQRQQKGMAELGELKQDYPYGSGFPETSPSFPRPLGQSSIGGINRAIGNPSDPTSTEMGYGFGPSQLPEEYQPDRPIPLGELQRRWGVPRLEDL